MLESLLNKDMVIKKEFLKTVICDREVYVRNFDFILKNLIKIKNLESFISGLILMNPKNYFGKYSLDYNKDLEKSISQKNNENFLKTFLSTSNRKIFKNSLLEKEILDQIKRYFSVEKETYFYLYQKKYYDISYPINIEQISILKRQIYDINNLNLETKFFSDDMIVKIKKGKNMKDVFVFDILMDMLESKNVNKKLNDYVLNNYNTEYVILRTICENCK